jgi:hypothetical protein
MNAVPTPQGKTTVVKKTISLPVKTYEKGEKRAARQNRNFSNYVAQLIVADSTAK